MSLEEFTVSDSLAQRTWDVLGVNSEQVASCDCRDPSVIVPTNTGKRWRVECCYCGKMTAHFKEWKPALKAWNSGSRRRLGKQRE